MKSIPSTQPFASLPSSIYGTGVFYARAILNLLCTAQVETVAVEVDDINIGLQILNEDLNIQENNSPRCFDNLGRQINCTDKWNPNVIKKRTKSGDFIIVK